MKKSAGATDADGGDAGRVRAKAADAAPAGPARFEDWEDYWKNSTPLPDDFEAIIAEMRHEELPLQEREPFD